MKVSTTQNGIDRKKRAGEIASDRRLFRGLLLFDSIAIIHQMYRVSITVDCTPYSN
jgi:hypothetical protein